MEINGTELVDHVAVAIPRPNNSFHLSYFAVLNNHSLATRLLSQPDVRVAYVDVYVSKPFPTVLAVYKHGEAGRVRLSLTKKPPAYVERYLKAHVDNPRDLDHIRIWCTNHRD